MKRTVFWKRMTALALAAILLLGLLPAAAFGAEPSDEPVQTKYVYEETDGVCRAVREEDALPGKARRPVRGRLRPTQRKACHSDEPALGNGV